MGHVPTLKTASDPQFPQKGLLWKLQGASICSRPLTMLPTFIQEDERLSLRGKAPPTQASSPVHGALWLLQRALGAHVSNCPGHAGRWVGCVPRDSVLRCAVGLESWWPSSRTGAMAGPQAGVPATHLARLSPALSWSSGPSLWGAWGTFGA